MKIWWYSKKNINEKIEIKSVRFISNKSLGEDFDKYQDMNLTTLNPMFSKGYYCEASHLTKKHL